MAETNATYCARHSKVESRLGCSKCGVLICPRCLVQTPVGARCPDCARVRSLPTFQVGAATMARATGAGVVLAGVTGVVWGTRLLRSTIHTLPAVDSHHWNRLRDWRRDKRFRQSQTGAIPANRCRGQCTAQLRGGRAVEPPCLPDHVPRRLISAGTCGWSLYSRKPRQVTAAA